MRKLRFAEIREEILKRIPGQQKEYDIGKKRQEKVAEALQELKNKEVVVDEERVVAGFIPVGDLTFIDIMRGFDFYVISISEGRGRYRVSRLSVTGERWLEAHQKRHPENVNIAVGLLESLESVKKKIIEAIIDGKH